MKKLSFLNFQLISLISGFIFGVGLITLMMGNLEIHLGRTLNIFKNGTSGLVLSFFGFLLFFYLRNNNSKEENDNNIAFHYFNSGILYSSVFLLLGNWSSLGFCFSINSSISIISLLIICLSFLLTPFINREHFKYLIYILSLILIIIFFQNTAFKPVYSDDHGSVTYRLYLLKNYFFSIPLYNAEWNAGMDWRDFFATGILNVYFLFLPLIALLSDIDTAYIIIVPTIIFILTPLSSYLGARILRLSHNAGLIAGFLALTSNAAWYKWSLSYGSMGFVCSSAVFPLFLACAIQTLKDKNDTKPYIILLMIFSGSLSILWSAQGLSIIPIIIYALFKTPELIKSKKIIFSALFLILIHLPWILIFINVSKVGNFVNIESGTKIESQEGTQTTNKELSPIVKGEKESINKKNILNSFRENTTKINPLIYLLIFSALFYPWDKTYQLLYGITIIWLLFLGTVVIHLKPQLELDRMLVIMSLILSIPIGGLIGSLLEYLEKNHPRNYSLSKSFILSFIIMSFLCIGGLIDKKSWLRYYTKSGMFNELAQIISNNADNGRTLFSGFILHDFSESHIAPLVRLSKKPIMASSPVHNLWRYTDIIPDEYRKRGPSGIEEYLDLYNVSLTIAHDRVWKKYFRDSSFKYEEIGILDKFVIFKRKRISDSYFYKGNGTLISQDAKGFKVKIDSNNDLNDLIDDSHAIVLRFNYFPFLKAENCSKISPYKVSDSVNFIKLSDCKKDSVLEVKSVSALRRIFN